MSEPTMPFDADEPKRTLNPGRRMPNQSGRTRRGRGSNDARFERDNAPRSGDRREIKQHEGFGRQRGKKRFDNEFSKDFGRRKQQSGQDRYSDSERRNERGVDQRREYARSSRSDDSRGERKNYSRDERGRDFRRKDDKPFRSRRRFEDHGERFERDSRNRRYQHRDDNKPFHRREAEEAREPKDVPPGLAPRSDEPATPKDVDLNMLPRQVRAELRGLPVELGQIVGAHLVAAGLLIEEDPELAYRHAEAARRRAARVPLVREACAETAYAAGNYSVALNEYRALRRMSGGDDYLPVMADCERAMGRPEEALKLARESQKLDLSISDRVEMRIVESGAREDLGQLAEALRLLKSGLEEFRDAPGLVQARLCFAYAEMLLRRGKEDAAQLMFEKGAQLDPKNTSGIGDRLSEFNGLSLELDFSVEDAQVQAEWEAKQERQAKSDE